MDRAERKIPSLLTFGPFSIPPPRPRLTNRDSVTPTLDAAAMMTAAAADIIKARD